MREIKFRAWDKEDKEMRVVSAINWFDEFVSLSEKPDGSYVRKRISEVEIMQYTGLKDKNGKEIYEGDIVSFIEIDEDSVLGREEKIIGKIEYLVSSGGFRCIEESGRRRELYLLVGFDPVYNLEIIGNIYENPELIK